MAAAIHTAGAAVLMIDSRGLGRPDRGPLTEATLYEDAEAAWLEPHWHRPDAGRRFVHRDSLGAAPALALTARHPDADGVVIEGAPTSIRELLRQSWIAVVYPIAPLLGECFDDAAKVRHTIGPPFEIHGRRDAVVPPSIGIERYLRSPGRKSLLLVERVTDSDAASVDPEAHQQVLGRLIPRSPERTLADLTRRAAPSRAG
jgi:hypothetical protein